MSSGDLETQVLGTSFNISAYKDDAHIRTTLIEGKVQVSGKGESGSPMQLILAPNEQAVMELNSGKLSSTEVDAAGYASWIQGKMEFHRESLDVVMKRLSRWYDFEYRFENETARELSFSARLDKSTPISDILDMLAQTTDVSFEYRAGMIVVY